MNGNEIEVWVSPGTGWSAGFEIVGVENGENGEEAFRIRRQSDGAVIPVALPADRIRPANSEPRQWP